MKAVRLGAELEGRLAATARHMGVTESEVIRMAIEQFCGQQAGGDDMLSLIELWEREDAGKPAVDVARRSSDLYGDELHREWSDRPGLLRAAEQPADYQ